MKYHKHYSTRKTSQKKPIPGKESRMEEMASGGFGFTMDDWTLLDLFLVLGAEGGSYYITESDMTVQNAEATIRCIQADGVRAVNRIVEISDEGRAPKNDSAIFALALALKFGDADTKRAAYQAVPKVCRIGTHLFSLADARKAFNSGWGRGWRNAVSNWYLGRSPKSLAQV